MARKRIPTDQERELFEDALADAVPLGDARPRPRRTRTAKPENPPPSITSARNRPKATPTSSGIDGNTADRLTRGLLDPQAKLDLHGLSQRDAHHALEAFLRAARGRGLRLVLVVTGKGGAVGSSDAIAHIGPRAGRRMPGILRSMAPRWLQEPRLAELIVDVREAHRRHGGAGALYIYLRKGRVG